MRIVWRIFICVDFLKEFRDSEESFILNLFVFILVGSVSFNFALFLRIR